MSFVVKCIAIDITNACNMSCKHCYKSKTDEIRNICVDNILDIIHKIEGNGEITNLILSGGETFLHPQIIELLEQLNGKYNIRINTNGLLLDKYIDVLCEMIKTKVQVSLDGYDEKTYFETRNCNRFHDVVDNAILAKQKGINIEFRASIHAGNVQNYSKFIELSNEVGIPIKLKPVIGLDNVEMKGLTIQELQTWFEAVQNDGMIAFVEGNVFDRGYTCLILDKIPQIGALYINEKGDMFPCLVLQTDYFKIGNIYDFTNESLDKEIRRVKRNICSLLSVEKCKRCEVRNAFGDGSCVAACYYGERNCLNKNLERWIHI